MTCFPLKGEFCTQQPFSPLTPLHVDFLVVYIEYSIYSEFIYMGLGLFRGGRCCKDKQNLCPLHEQIQRTTCSDSKLLRFWTKHAETAHAPQQESFAVPHKQGGSWHVTHSQAHLVSPVSHGSTAESLQQPLYKECCSLWGWTFRYQAAIEDPAQGKQQPLVPPPLSSLTVPAKPPSKFLLQEILGPECQ